MRFCAGVASGGEGTFGANAGLPTVALKLLQPITDKYVGRLKAISHADLWALAANVAIEHMGGPKIPTRFGRKDASSSAESVESQVGRLPDGDKVLRVEKAQRLSPCSRLESTHWALLGRPSRLALNRGAAACRGALRNARV